MLREELRAFTRAADDIELIGAARTDSGVHALSLPAHFDLPLGDMALAHRIMAAGSEKLLLRWNRRLPPVMATLPCSEFRA
jgi:tRNA U38,U39,U40 pseudouridine synthase TruA